MQDNVFGINTEYKKPFTPLQQRLFQIKLVTVDGYIPIENAKINVEFEHSYWKPLKISTDNEGTVIFPRRETGEFKIRLLKEGKISNDKKAAEELTADEAFAEDALGLFPTNDAFRKGLSLNPGNKSKAIILMQDKYPIIFIPGAMGTSLSAGERTLWPTFSADDMLALRQNDDGTDVTDGIKAGRAIRKIYWDLPRASPLLQLMPPPISGMVGTYRFVSTFIKKVRVETVYHDFFEFFTKNNYPEDEWLFEYGYDWRKNPAEAAKGLAKKVEDVKKERGVQKVIIIAHSMGGLVARYYAIKNSSNIHILIQLGTPNNGSPTAYAMIKYGRRGPIPWFIPGGPNYAEYRLLARNMLGVYLLLPNEKYFDVFYPGGFLTAWDKNQGKSIERTTLEETYLQYPSELPNKSLVEKAMKIYQELGTESHCSNTHIFFGTGDGNDTIGRIIEQSEDLDEEPEFVYTSGDGTVPSLSVENLNDVEVTNRHDYPDVEHVELTQNQDVLKHILKIIKSTH